MPFFHYGTEEYDSYIKGSVLYCLDKGVFTLVSWICFFIIGVSDSATDGLSMVFNTTPGHDYLSKYRSMTQRSIASLSNLGLSSIANIIGAIKYAKYMDRSRRRGHDSSHRRRKFAPNRVSDC